MKYENLEDLLKIKNIGPRRLLNLKRIYSTIEEVKEALKNDKCPMCDDVVLEMRKELLGEENAVVNSK